MNRAFFSTVRANNRIYASDYPASERMKFFCVVSVYASGTVSLNSSYNTSNLRSKFSNSNCLARNPSKRMAPPEKQQGNASYSIKI